MYCKKCGEDIDNDSVFCNKCGVKLQETKHIDVDSSKQRQQLTNNKCPRCGDFLNEAEQENNLCDKCFIRINSTADKVPAYSVSLPTPPKQTKGCLVGIVVIVTICLATYLLSSITGEPGDFEIPTSSNVSSEAIDYEKITHSTAVECIQEYLEQIEITKYDRLGWYYPEIYKEDNYVYYSSSKLDYSGSDHAYTVGIIYSDDISKSECVYLMIDDKVLIDKTEES